MGSWGNSPDILVDPYGNNDGGVKIIVFSVILEDTIVKHVFYMFQRNVSLPT